MAVNKSVAVKSQRRVEVGMEGLSKKHVKIFGSDWLTDLIMVMVSYVYIYAQTFPIVYFSMCSYGKSKLLRKRKSNKRRKVCTAPQVANLEVLQKSPMRQIF